MAEETKKISFGFSKLKKPSNLVKVPQTDKSEIEYVDSFDGAKGKFSYKGNVRCDEPVKKELVIPLIGTKSISEVIQLKLEEKNLKNAEDNTEKSDDAEIKIEKKTDLVKEDDSKRSNLPEENKPLSIDDLAAKEILNDLQNNLNNAKSSSTLVIKQTSKVSRSAEEMQIDYENIPVSEYGLAMLRGMGWTPESGIGKDQKVVQVVVPKLRPKGLGLGADKAMKNKAAQDRDLTISLKSYVKFASGAYKGNYGQVEAMDDDTGRVTVKLALGGGMVSASEVFLTPITKKDYEKNSKVINPTKYEDFKEKAGSDPETNKKKEVEYRSSERESKEDKSNRHRKERYDRSYGRDEVIKREDEERSLNGRKRYSSSDSSSVSSPERTKHKKSKKSSRNYSEDRKHKKSSKKKKRKKKYSDYDEDSDERKYRREKSSHRHHHSKSKHR